MFSKYVLGPLLILVRLMPVLLTMPTRGDLCPNYPIGEDRDQIVMHINYTSGRQHCCKQVMCTAGHEVKYCSANNPNDTSCVPCKPGFYNPDNQMSYNNPRCIAWRNCSEKLGLVYNNDGTAISPGTCRCNGTDGYYKNKWGIKCNRRTEKCEPDHELNIENGECQPCRAGTEQLVHGFGPCIECPINSQKLNGHTNCSRCPPGTYKPKPGYGKCQTCAELIDNGINAAKCVETKLTPTPKVGATKENDDRDGDSTVAIAVGVSVSVLLIVLLVIVGLYAHRRRKQKAQEKRSTVRKSPIKTAAGPYRAVSENSTSSDNSSHSSAEDAIEAEKVKAQNQANLTATVVNEKTALPDNDISTDYAHQPGQGRPNGYPQGYPQGQPNGFPQGQPNGYPPGVGGLYQAPPEQGGFLIVNPSNCNISLGQQNQLHMTPNQPPAVTQPPVHAPHPPRPHPPEDKINNLNMPRSRQSAPPTLDTNQQSAAPVDFHRAPGGEPPYYEDDADRLAAYYNGPSEC